MSLKAEAIDRLRSCIGDLKHVQDLALFMDPLSADERNLMGRICDDAIFAIRMAIREECHKLQNSSTDEKPEK